MTAGGAPLRRPAAGGPAWAVAGALAVCRLRHHLKGMAISVTPTPSARVTPRRGLRSGALAVPALLAACQPMGPEARRDAYLRCAQAQGLAVEGGTILSRGPGDLARLDACEPVAR